MLHARGQSTAELQQKRVDRLHRHTIHRTSAGMAHANGPTARATVNCTSWWWGQEQRVVLDFGDADTTQKATGATSAQILDFVCVICTSIIVLLRLVPLFISLSPCVCLCSRVPHNDIAKIWSNENTIAFLESKDIKKLLKTFLRVKQIGPGLIDLIN